MGVIRIYLTISPKKLGVSDEQLLAWNMKRGASVCVAMDFDRNYVNGKTTLKIYEKLPNT
eukprot:TRINITY_DN13619_c0_g1_i2.p1 TRINITY_DN13619_c0_g1~~TRINITY_DN13619_c0_g1_i2.p1  ORF type:complete len:60 (+),score=7.28 TRINITY_DN13619_c0_g1_i2:686-865(+)